MATNHFFFSSEKFYRLGWRLVGFSSDFLGTKYTCYLVPCSSDSLFNICEVRYELKKFCYGEPRLVKDRVEGRYDFVYVFEILI